MFPGARCPSTPGALLKRNLVPPGPLALPGAAGCHGSPAGGTKFLLRHVTEGTRPFTVADFVLALASLFLGQHARHGVPADLHRGLAADAVEPDFGDLLHAPGFIFAFGLFTRGGAPRGAARSPAGGPGWTAAAADISDWTPGVETRRT